MGKGALQTGLYGEDRILPFKLLFLCTTLGGGGLFQRARRMKMHVIRRFFMATPGS